jgi:hypothetical protein
MLTMVGLILYSAEALILTPAPFYIAPNISKIEEWLSPWVSILKKNVYAESQFRQFGFHDALVLSFERINGKIEKALYSTKRSFA